MPDTSLTQRLLHALKSGGLLLLQDKTFPSIVALVTGEPLSGSWWSHPLAHEIFGAVGAIAAHPDVLACKLMSGKVTFVHRRLWPSVFAVATAREPWQTAALSRDAFSLWEQVEQEGSVIASGKASKEIENRLLTHGEQFHSESGPHKIRLETWRTWSLRAGCETSMSAREGRSHLETAVLRLGGSIKNLPWHRLRLKSAKGVRHH